DQRIVEQRALARLLARADEEVARGAVQAAQALPPISACAEGAPAVPPPADAVTAGRVAAIRAQLAEARALDGAGTVKAAVPLATSAVDEARRSGYRPVEADALVLLAQARADDSDAAGAEELLYQALAAAQAGRHDAAVADASIMLVKVAGDDLGRIADGE